MPEPLIRPATPEDAADLALLIDMAGDGLPTYFWSHSGEVSQSPLETGRTRIMREQGPFSYRNAAVAEADGKVAGALVSRRIDDNPDLSEVKDLHEVAQPLIRLEAEVPGHWYVNVLAVYPWCRRQGLGGRLLDHANALGRTAATRGMAIIVASENLDALRLYERVGYRTKASRPLVGHPVHKRGGDWILLTKPHS